MTRFHRQEVDLTTRITNQQLQLRLQSCIEPRIAAVNLMAMQDRSSVEDLLANWDSLAYPLTNMLPGFQAINFIDTNWVIRHVYPAASNQAALGAELAQSNEATVIASLDRAEQTGELVRTGLVELLQSGTGFVMYRQIRSSSGEPLGFINGVFRVRDLVDACFFEQDLQDRFEYRLLESDGQVVISGGATNLPVAAEYGVRNLVNIAGRPWTLELTPTQEFLRGEGSLIAYVWTVLGMILVAILAYVTRALLIKQDSLRISQERYRLLVENQTDLVVETDADGNLRYVSPSYCQLFGKKENELVNSNFFQLLHEEDRGSTRHAISQLSANNPVVYQEQRAFTEKGWRWLGWSNSAVLDAGGNLQGITAVGRDITDIKLLEQQIAHSAKMNAIGELAGGVTHDLNNLLHVTLANVELLLEQVEDTESRERLENIRRVINSGMDLSSKLSTLSRQGPEQLTHIDLNSMIVEAYNLLADTMDDSILVELKTAPSPVFVEGDRTQIERVILNLIINARDAIQDSGKIEIELSQEFLDSEFCRPFEYLTAGEFAKISIIDNGAGIKPENLSRVFDPFFTTKELGKGTGLGLANCYSIIKQHFGCILVESEVGVGTIFTVYLPLTPHAGVYAGSRIDRVVRDPMLNNSKEKDSEPGKKVIMIVDDNEDILSLTSSFITTAGYDVIVCRDGQEAVSKFVENQAAAELVLMDLMMPGMSGSQAAAKIHNLAPQVKMLFISGFFHEQEDAIRELQYPLLRKPFTRAELLEKIAILIQ